MGTIKAGESLQVLEASTDETVVLPMPIPGEHNAVNLLLAVAAARQLDQSWENILAGLERYESPPMRWEKSNQRGVCFINDAYNANPMSMIAAINTFTAMPCEGRRWLVLGGMFELGADEAEHHRRLGQFVGTHTVDGVVTVGRHGEWIMEGIKDAAGEGAPRLIPCETTHDAADALRARLEAGDSVLLKGSRGARLENILNDLHSETQQADKES